MGSNRLAIWGLIALAGVLLAACGASGESSGGTGLSKAMFVKQANAICYRAVADRSASIESVTTRLVAEGHLSAQTEQKEIVKEAVIPTELRMVTELAKLSPPDGDAPMIEEIVAGLEQGLQRIEAEPSIAFEPVVVTHADVLAESYGLPECRV